MSPRRRRLQGKLSSLYLWHRYAGLVVAMFAAWLAVTGIILNHGDDLELADSYVTQGWLLDFYGIHKEESLQGIPVAGHWLVGSGDLGFIDRQRILFDARPVGAAEIPDGFVIAFADHLQLYTSDAVLVETMPFTAGNADITAIGSIPDGRVVVTSGNTQFVSDAELIAFSMLRERIAVRHLQAEPVPESVADDIANLIRQRALSWERVLQDMHSGRILGKAGFWMTDIAGGLLLLLAISGVIIWYRRWRYQRRREHH